MEKIIIAAVSKNGAIGKDNALLWHLREDLKYFKATTLGHPVIMGRRTFESIGRPLPGRLNIVVSRTLKEVDGVVVVPSLPEAYRRAEEYIAKENSQSTDTTLVKVENPPKEENAPQGGRCFVIGGAQLYSEAISSADSLYLTAIKAIAPEADKFFPTIDSGIWLLASSSEPKTDPETGIVFTFDVWTRRK